jgi:hypothetical protein
MSELKYNEPAERFAPIVEKSLYAGATAVMVPSETGCWVHYVEYCERVANIKSEADKAIAELKEERRWRKFPDEKPEWGKDVLISDKDGDLHIVHFSHDFKWISWGKMNTCESDCVTYWMPMPSAPKEEGV